MDAEIVIVCHGGSGRVILEEAGSEPMLLENAAVAVLDRDESRWRVMDYRGRS